MFATRSLDLKDSAIQLFLLCLAATLLGCSSIDKTSVAYGPADITAVHIITLPVALNLDGKPGLDGFSLKVFANDAHNPKPVPIRSGTLEILAFDGTLARKTNLPPPLRIWSFSAEDLKRHEFRAGIGTGYEMTLAWGTNRPTQRMITLGARYTSPAGSVTLSHPSSITVMDK
jgi:hypothetical protein